MAYIGTANIPGAQLFINDNGASILSPSTTSDTLLWIEDFIFTDGARIPRIDVTFNGTASSATLLSPSDANHIGILDFVTGTDTGGQSGYYSFRPSTSSYLLILGGGYQRLDFVVNIPTLATGGEDYVFTIGFGVLFDAFSSAEPGTDGAYFQYNRSSSANWIGATKAASAVTTASGGTPTAVTTGWHHLAIVVNAGATSVSFFVDSVLIGTSAANIPTVALAIGCMMRKTAGTTSRDIQLDVHRYFKKFTTSRFT